MEQLPRKLGLADATLIVIGIVIGSGIFLLPNVIARNVPSRAAMLGVWVAAGLLSYCGALAYAELGALMPATGGQYVFLREAFGPGCAFVCGWTFVLAVVPGGIAFLSVGFSIYLAQFVPLGPGMRNAISVALIVLLSGINYLGVRESAWVQRIFTAAKIAGLALVIAAAWLPGRAVAAASPAGPPLTWNGVGVALAACLMAYNGWSYVSFVAGEVTDAERNVPRSLALGTLLVMALYLLANLAYFHILTVGEIAASERVGADLAARVMGPHGAAVLSAIVLVSVIGALNGCVLTGPRIPFAQAQDGLFFRRFAEIHPRFRTPAFSIAAQAAWSGVLILSGSYETLCSYAIVSAWIFYTLTVLAVWKLRRAAPGRPRPYRMWGYPWTMWTFVAVSAWFLGDAVAGQPKPALSALAVAAAGIPVYFWWRRAHRLSRAVV